MKKSLILGIIFLSFVLVGSFGVVSGEEDVLIKENVLLVEGQNLTAFEFVNSSEVSCSLNRDDLNCKSYIGTYYQVVRNPSNIYEETINPSGILLVTIEDNSEDITNSQFNNWVNLIKEDDSDNIRGFRVSTYSGMDDEPNKVYQWISNDYNGAVFLWYNNDKIILLEEKGLSEEVGASSGSSPVLKAYLERYPSKGVLPECDNNECSLDGKCYPLGYRIQNEYCGPNKEFASQLEENEQCNNSFECGSNLCIDNQCIESGLFVRIISWFKNLFS